MFQFLNKVKRYANFRISQFIISSEQMIFAAMGFIRSAKSNSQFEIKAGYFINKEDLHFNDTSNKDEYQNEVYQHAQLLMSRHHLSTVLDIGCGSAFKLMKYMSQYDTTGIDVQSTVEFLKHQYPDRNWLETAKIKESSLLTADLIICADVIEHVQDPTQLLTFINRIRDWKFLVISTPDRDMARGRWSYGPPPNVFHIREWNREEAIRFLGKYFEVLESTITNKAQSTHMLVCTKKSAQP